MTESTNNTTAADKVPLERCAELATWHQIETDPAQKERIAAALTQCVQQAAQQEAAKRAEQEAKERAIAAAARAAKQMQTDNDKAEAEAKARAVIAAEHAAWEKEMLARQEARTREPATPERTRERTIEIPAYIREGAAYQRILEAQRETQASLVHEQARRYAAEQQAINYQGMRTEARMEAYQAQEDNRERKQQHDARQDPATPGVEGGFDPYEAAAAQLDAKPLRSGQEVEGEIVDVAKINGQNYYVLEQGGERVALPAGGKTEHGKGDDISASYGKGGIEVEAAYGYGR